MFYLRQVISLTVSTFYEGIDLSSADKVRDLMVAQFCGACTLEYEIPVGSVTRCIRSAVHGNRKSWTA